MIKRNRDKRKLHVLTQYCQKRRASELRGVVAARESIRVAGIRAADAHAAVAALVQEYSDAAVLLPHDQDGVFAHIVRGVVARFLDLGFMPQQKPRPAEDALQLDLVQEIGRASCWERVCKSV